jgi:hypothetical protein
MNRNPKTLVLPEFSNREDIYLQFGVFDDDTGDPIDMTALGWTFQFEIRRLPPLWRGPQWVGPWYDDELPAPLIILALGTGPDAVNVLGVGAGLIWVSESNVRGKLHHRTYQAALVANDGTRQFQLFNATLPMQYGGVTN